MNAAHQRNADKRHIGFLIMQEAPPHRIAKQLHATFGSAWMRELAVAALDADIASLQTTPEQLRKEGGL
jgi:hypothetical protein